MFHRKFIGVLLILASTAVPALADSIAQVVGLSGSATISGKAASVNSTVNEHDKIDVASGNVQLLFTDGTRLVVGEHSSLVIEKYLMKGGNKAQALGVDALRGTFRFITGNSAKSAYDIQTANATIGIRGTGFDFWVSQDTGVAVLKGKVHLCRKGKKSCVDIEANCHAGIAQPDGARPLLGYEQSASMKNHLPFIIDQSRLRSDFHLNTASCERILELTNQGGGNAPPPPTGCRAKCG
ncbi:MAG: FecR domain-containing protein [Alphaproteobacteria bacterium]|nr:FecR domain-containing protein [Alphaproteobacteria bacterium]